MTTLPNNHRVILISGANKGIGNAVARSGHRTVEQAATVIVHLATLQPDGPTGGFFSDDGALPW